MLLIIKQKTILNVVGFMLKQELQNTNIHQIIKKTYKGQGR